MVKSLAKEMRQFGRMQAQIDKTEQYQQDGNSSGDEDYKLIKKYQHYRYRKVRFKPASLGRIAKRKRDLFEIEDDSDDGAGLEVRAEQSSELAPEVQEIIGKQMYPLKRKKCRNLDKEEAERAKRDEAQRMEELQRQIMEKTMLVVRKLARPTAIAKGVKIDLTRTFVQ